RHEIFRTTFPTVDGRPVQRIHAPWPVRLPVADLSGLAEADRAGALEALTRADSRVQLDLARLPLVRWTLARLSPGEHRLLHVEHHVIHDGWSFGIFLGELAALYTARVRGEPSPLPPLPVQFADFAVWHRALMEGERARADLRWWKEKLTGADPVLELPTDRPRPPVMSFRGSSRRVRIPPAAALAARAFARESGATLHMTLLAAYEALLHRYSGQEDFCVGSSVANRSWREAEPLIGMVVNTIALRARLAEARSFRALVGQVRETAREAYAHKDVHFGQVVEAVQPERSLGWLPIYQVAFNFHDSPYPELTLPGVALDVTEALGNGSAKFDLQVISMPRAEMRAGAPEELIESVWEYATDLFDGATVERMIGHFHALLGALLADPDADFREVAFLAPAERERVLEEWNDTARGYPAGLRVHDLFAAQAERTPGAVALVHRGEAVTYAELDRRSAALARHLRARGVGPEVRGGVCMARTPELVAALLAVLRAGGAYVPLDPAYPRERLGWMMEDAEVALVLTSAALAGVLPAGHAEVVAVDALRGEPESDGAAPESGVLPENLSHVIFTSGSTGRPKGVMIRHSSVVVLLHWLREVVSDEERSAVLFSTSVNFDVSVAEVFGTLAWGGRLLMVENALELASLPEREEVRLASMVPTAAAELLRMGAVPRSIRTLNLGGEPLPADLARGLYALGTVEKVGNLYGPTEDTTYSTYSPVERDAERVLVGRP
ncbi:MAG TPA: condensation domain-containing protein, partial [Longimicrobiaceae bacterium]|nr:condensation domain-containing protein [Longimicrobiaceae bacterium]